jgi:hypothetical protein
MDYIMKGYDLYQLKEEKKINKYMISMLSFSPKNNRQRL